MRDFQLDVPASTASAAPAAITLPVANGVRAVTAPVTVWNR